MNHSHKQWNSVSLTMLSTAIHNGTAHEAKAVYQIAPSGRAYVYSEGDGKSELWISDGRSWLQERSTDNTYTVLRISSQKQEELRDFVAPTTVDSMTFPHPFGSLIPVQGAELLYPTGIAQSLLRNGKITVVGNDTVANRDTVVVQRENFADDGTLIKKHLYWVDAETGVILQAQIFNPGSADQWQVQHTVVEISFDVPLPTETFDLVPKLPNSRYIPPEEFYDLEELP
ncbi:MAG TPA: hypothetical protein PKD55_25715, partial [Bellilinea sp.]|nr:hypothetical protein [Bellilinea sp.]